MDHRRGRGRILSPGELQVYLAIPIYYVLLGRAEPAFPNSASPHPSSFVQINRIRAIEPNHVSAFPVTVNWRQWRDIFAPLLADCRWPNYLGSTGGCYDETAILRDYVGPGVYSCNASLRSEYVELIGREIRRRAEEAGY